MRHFMIDGHVWGDDELPPYFWDQYDSDIMRIDVTRIGSVPYRQRMQARAYHQAKREAGQYLAAQNKLPYVVVHDP